MRPGGVGPSEISDPARTTKTVRSYFLRHPSERNDHWKGLKNG